MGLGSKLLIKVLKCGSLVLLIKLFLKHRICNDGHRNIGTGEEGGGASFLNFLVGLVPSPYNFNSLSHTCNWFKIQWEKDQRLSRKKLSIELVFQFFYEIVIFFFLGEVM